MNKHRGITKDTREWVYGEKITVGDRVFITCKTPRELIGIDCSEGLVRLRIDCHEIIPQTLGVYSGKDDSEGKNIFTGDGLLLCPVYWCTVSFEEGCFVTKYSHPEDGETIPFCDQDFSESTITGTIHDHLLNEKKEK